MIDLSKVEQNEQLHEGKAKKVFAANDSTNYIKSFPNHEVLSKKGNIVPLKVIECAAAAYPFSKHLSVPESSAQKTNGKLAKYRFCHNLANEKESYVEIFNHLTK